MRAMAVASEPTEVDAAPVPRDRIRWWALGIFVLAAVPRLATAGRYATTDELQWMHRSSRFADAVLHLRLSEATASVGEPATMPGGTTMWIGAVARGLWRLGVDVGLLNGKTFVSADGLAVAQALHSLVTAALVVALFVAVTRWVGLVAGLAAALLVGFDPWSVALGAVLHTDELCALFGVVGLVALAYALGVPNRTRLPARPLLVAAGAGLALMAAAMTKVTGTGYWVGAGVILVWAIVLDRREGKVLTAPGAALRAGAVAAGVGIVAMLILWPAILADPLFQLERLNAAVGLRSGTTYVERSGSLQYFLGEPANAPGWSYYPIALAFRMTPWFFLATVVGIPAAFAWRSTRPYALVFVAPLISLFVVLSGSSKKFDRYGLLLLTMIAVVVGIAVQRALRDRVAERTATGLVAGVGGVAVLMSLVVAPWGLAYFNPLLGGSSAGHHNLLVGWGEGKRVAVERIQELEGGDCSGTVIAGLRQEPLQGYPCAVSLLSPETADYAVVYVSDIQRDPNARAWVEGRELVDVVEIRGIPYAEIWR